MEVPLSATHLGNAAMVKIVSRHQDRELHVIFTGQRRLISRGVPQEVPAQRHPYKELGFSLMLEVVCVFVRSIFTSTRCELQRGLGITKAAEQGTSST